MTADVFEVFDQRSQAPTPPPGRGAAVKSLIAVLLSLGLLASMAGGAWWGYRKLTAADPSVCSAAQTQRQVAMETWLSDLSEDALGKRDAAVTPLGCSETLAPPSAALAVVDEAALAQVLTSLADAGCKAPSTKLPATCSVTPDGGAGQLQVVVQRADDAQTDGDYEVLVSPGTATTAS